MSDTTKAALDLAIEAHMTDEHNETVLLNGYILQAAGSILSDDRQALLWTSKDRQSGVTTMGLLSFMNYNAEGVTYGGSDDDE